MISIVFAVPYPTMEQSVLEVFAAHPLRRQLREYVKVIQAEELDEQTLEGSVVVARGLTYRRIIQQHPHMPCVEIKVHTADILMALVGCRERAAPRRIALIGHFPNLPDADMLRAFVGCDVRYYRQDSMATFDENIARALADGCDMFASGYSVCHWAEENGHPHALITSSPEAIHAALDEAIRTYAILQRNETAKIALENTREPVIYLDDSLAVTYANPAAIRLIESLGLDSGVTGRPLASALPFLAAIAPPGASTPVFCENELRDVEGVALAVSCSPVRVGNSEVGAVVTLATVDSIRDQEYSIRQKLSDKGLRARYTFADVVYCSDAMGRLLEKAKKCAQAPSNVLLIGETGTGKELFAQSVHNHSARKAGPFVAVNCAALPENLIESELFGYSDGAFTGARKGGKIGLMETAHGGTIFLDEVSELPLPVQGKLLRALQEREVRRLGDAKVVSVDVRVISAANVSLPDCIRQGRFRRDLFYRLDILNLYLPPLRERPEDIVELFWTFLREHNRKSGAPIASLSLEAKDLLLSHPFEGNVRELRNLVERLCVLHGGGHVGRDDLWECLRHEVGGGGEFPRPAATPPARPSAPGDEAARIRDALARFGHNRGRTARELGMDRSTLWRKMRRYGIGAETGDRLP